MNTVFEGMSNGKDPVEAVKEIALYCQRKNISPVIYHGGFLAITEILSKAGSVATVSVPGGQGKQQKGKPTVGGFGGLETPNE